MMKAILSGGRQIAVHVCLFAAAALYAVPEAAASDGDWRTELWQPDRKWSLTAYLGQFDDKRFVEILSFRGGDLQSAYMAGVALNRRFATTLDDALHWEIEGGLYHHWGKQDHAEATAAIVARWTKLPWNEYVNTSVAFGQGISLASDRPAMEGETRAMLNYLLAEVEVVSPSHSSLSFVGRVHHRSGVFGLYGARGGTNFITAGIRYRF